MRLLEAPGAGLASSPSGFNWRRLGSPPNCFSPFAFWIASDRRVRLSKMAPKLRSACGTTNVGLVMYMTALSQPTCPAIDAMVFQLLGLTPQDTLPE
jgi:hypothetical protein